MLYPHILAKVSMWWSSSDLLFPISFRQFSCKRSSPRLWRARQWKGNLWRRGWHDHPWICYLHKVSNCAVSFLSCLSSDRVRYLKDSCKTGIAASSCPNIYLRVTVGPPSTSSPRHYYSVCGSSANYTYEAWNTVLFMWLSSHTQWYPIYEICGLIWLDI